MVVEGDHRDRGEMGGNGIKVKSVLPMEVTSSPSGEKSLEAVDSVLLKSSLFVENTR